MTINKTQVSPEEYLKNCIDPFAPVGYIWCMIDNDAKENGWTLDQVAMLKYAVEQKYKDGLVFVFPKKVRYV